MVQYLCSLPNEKGKGSLEQLFSDDPLEIAAFVKKWNVPGRAVYRCVNPLKPGSTRRSLETLDKIERFHCDIDFKDVEESPEQIEDRLLQLLVPVTVTRKSGGGLHLIWELKEPLPADDEHARDVLRRLTAALYADPAPAHPAALLRELGSHNSKRPGEPVLVEDVWGSGEPVDISELEDLLDYLPEGGLFTKLPQAGNGMFRGSDPVDVEAELQSLTAGASANLVQTRIIPHLLRKRMEPAEVLKFVVDETMARVGVALSWSRKVEVRYVRSRILSAYNNLLLKDYHRSEGMPPWLPTSLHQQWQERLADGGMPVIGFNLGGFYVRSREGTKPNANQGQEAGDKHNGDGATPLPARITLLPFKPIDPATFPPRRFLYGKHYQRGSVGATIAPGGTGKTSLVLVEGVALAAARNLLGEQPEERCRVWIHNGDDDTEELDRRIMAICQYYDIPMAELDGWLFRTSGAEMPLKVANGYNELKIDDRLVDEMTARILEHEIDVVLLDPLITLHGTGESDNPKMDQVVRLFKRMAGICDCFIDLSHHTRKLPAGVAVDHSVDDGRGASAIRDAVRVMRVLNVMSKDEGRDLFGEANEFDRLSYFRVDRGKANVVPPSKTAVWRKLKA
jgi:hypothetical protein